MRMIQCIETGVIYLSIQRAADAHGIHRDAIQKVLRGATDTAAGYHWEYVKDQYGQPKRQGPRRSEGMTIRQVIQECERRTKETGRYWRYADIQKEETLRKIKEGKQCHTKKRK